MTILSQGLGFPRGVIVSLGLGFALVPDYGTEAPVSVPNGETTPSVSAPSTGTVPSDLSVLSVAADDSFVVSLSRSNSSVGRDAQGQVPRDGTAKVSSSQENSTVDAQVSGSSVSPEGTYEA